VADQDALQVCLANSFLGECLQNGLPYAIGLFCPVCCVCDGVLWRNGCVDQDVTWCGNRPQPRPHCVRWGPSSCPHGKGHSSPPLSQFMGAGFACIRIIRGSCLLWPNGWTDQDAIWYGGRPRPGPHCVRLGPSSPFGSLPQKGTAAPVFGPCLLWPNGWMDQDATWYRGRPQPRQHCVRWGPSSPTERGTAAPPPLFGPCLLCQNGRSS